MDTELLRTFLEVQKTRHFAKAAENLFLTPSAVSFRIRQLEKQLGVNLFTRQRNNIHLTPAGERLVGHAESVLMTWQRARQDIALDSRHSEQLVIGASANLWDSPLRHVISHLYQHFPELAIRADVVPNGQVERWVNGGALDMVLTCEPPKFEELAGVSLFDLKLVAVCAPELLDGASPGYLNRWAKVDWGVWFTMQHAQAFPGQSPAVLHTNLGRVAYDFIRDYSGAAYLPDVLVADDVQSGQLALIPDAPVFTRKIYAVFDNEHASQQLISDICDELKGLGEENDATASLRHHQE